MIAIYTRQSVDKKDSLSIELQIEFCKKECSHGESFVVFSDKGFSGKNTERPKFQEMMEAVSAGKIIIYRLDRLSRSIVDFGHMWEALERYHVDFISINEKFDTTTPMGNVINFSSC